MKVAHIVSHLDTGGAEKLVAEISNLMVPCGVKIKVITLFNGRGVPFQILDKDNIELIELNYSSKYNPKIARELYKLTRDCDIVHTHTYYAQLYASIFIPKIKLVTTEHSTNNNRRGKKIMRIFDYLMYRRYMKIICISEATKNSLNKWLKSTKDKSIIIHNGVNLSKYLDASSIPRAELGVDKSKIILTCVGRLEKAKNQEALIRAFKGVDVDAAILLLIGHGQKEKELKELVKELKLNDKVIFLGQRNDVERILKTSDIFILPSLWEGFGLSAVEAVAAGLPLLLSNVAGLKDVINALNAKVDYFDPVDVSDITLKINEMCNDTINVGQTYSIRKDKLESYSLDNMVNKYLESYKVN
ncbi:glycosyltransferase [Priestia aryabhattai]|uniref:glycosyltransferase n=1 Tax=Priestia aryabhattai TaxID=412384 RepID=UPI001C8D505C|nr:glycosyltransferase [Priestia aryabhattai]MBX9993186.1 glycosyltransferase [Priestia aryabhattai]